MKFSLSFLSMILCVFSISNAFEWNTEEILDHAGIGSDCDLEIDQAGQLHICFQYMHNILPGSNLYYGLKPDETSNWEITEVDAEDYDFVGDDCEIDLDSNDNPHISYIYEIDYEYLPYVKYAAYSGSSWTKEQITFSPQWAGPGTSLVIDSDDNPHIFYPRYQELRYQWNDGTDVWSSETLESGYMFRYPHAAEDTSGNIGVAYFFLPYESGQTELHYAYNDGASWTIETVFNANPCVSTWQLDMVYDQSGYPHIAYVASTVTDNLSHLLHTWYDGATWNTDNLGTTSSGSYTFPSIAVDSNSAVHITYSLRSSSSGDGVLHHISDESDTWIDVIVKDDINSWNTAIDIDQFNQPHIIYYNYAGGITSHAWRTDVSGVANDSFCFSGSTLQSPAPNPSSGCSLIQFTVSTGGSARLELYDISGRLVDVLSEGFHQAGQHEAEVSNLTPGVYLFRFSAGDTVETRKLVVF